MNDVKEDILLFKSEFLKLKKLIEDNIVIDDKSFDDEEIAYIEKDIEYILAFFV